MKIKIITVLSIIGTGLLFVAAKQECPNIALHRTGIGYSVIHGSCVENSRKFNMQVKTHANCNGGVGIMSQHCGTVAIQLSKYTNHYDPGTRCTGVVKSTEPTGTLLVRSLVHTTCNWNPDEGGNGGE